MNREVGSILNLFQCNNSEKSEKRIVAFAVLAISAIFFLGIAIVDGPVWCVDSAGYTSMDFSREPVYPVFLMVLRKIFGESIFRNDLPIYLFAAVIIQSVLWIYATFRASMYIYELAEKKCSSRIMVNLITLCACFSQFLTPFLNRFVVQRHSMYSESIMTESVAMPLFVLFCIRLSIWLSHRNKKDGLLLILIGFLIINTRKQMMVVLLLWIVMSFLYDIWFGHNNRSRAIFTAIVATVFLVLFSRFVDSTYNYFARGIFHEHTGNKMGILCTLIYSADRDELENDINQSGLGDEGDLFIRIFDECIEQNLLYDSVKGSDWRSVTEHYADSYDIIGYEVLRPLCDEYLSEKYPDATYDQMRILDDELEADFANVLKGQNKMDLISVYAANLLRAFIYSNANMSPSILAVISMIIYFVFIVLLIYGLIESKKKAYADVDREIYTFSAISLMGLAINAFTVAFIIFPQGRYMAYATGLFYTALMVMIFHRLIGDRK